MDEMKDLTADLKMTEAGREFFKNAELPTHTYPLRTKIEDMVEPYKKMYVIRIPEGATNGDMIKALFNIPDSEIDEGLSTTYIYTKTRVLKGGSQDRLRERITFNRDWWNAPFRKEKVNGQRYDNSEDAKQN